MSRTKLEDPDQIVEEYEANKATDIELEESDTAGNSHDRPYDPAAIRVDPKTFSLRQIIDMIDDGDLDLAPDFQRNQVWKEKAKSRLIESILLRIPLPAFYFSADGDGRLRVVDGLQRLSTVHSFVRGAPTKKARLSSTTLSTSTKVSRVSGSAISMRPGRAESTRRRYSSMSLIRKPLCRSNLTSSSASTPAELRLTRRRFAIA